MDRLLLRISLLGAITGLTDTVLPLALAENTRIKVTRDAIAGPQVKEDGKKEEAKKVKGG